jgi:18S rRNA (adenine1779-N6/adenine1780-N6)-dimethyltransferase
LTKNYAAANLVSLSTSSNSSRNNQQTPKDYQELERLVLEKVEKVLGNGFVDKRARMLDVDDFIKLLVEFNKENVHFA